MICLLDTTWLIILIQPLSNRDIITDYGLIRDDRCHLSLLLVPWFYFIQFTLHHPIIPISLLHFISRCVSDSCRQSSHCPRQLPHLDSNSSNWFKAHPTNLLYDLNTILRYDYDSYRFIIFLNPIKASQMKPTNTIPISHMSRKRHYSWTS